MDTIHALSTAQGKAGVAVIRVSGMRVPDVAAAICGKLPTPRRATFCILRDHDGQRLDEALVLYFPDQASFTGEPVLEFHVHGSQAVVRAVLEAVQRLPGLRPAEAGEFTRRALSNGRLDLTQVEALSDLIESETETQRQQAIRVLAGGLKDACAQWRLDLIRAVALLEATIDFADEDIPEIMPEVRDLISGVKKDLDRQISGHHAAERIREGFEIAIIGAPNVGKSTLLNRLSGRDAAITSEVAGTTRDVIEVRMDINGLPVTFLDTAGLRNTEDHVENLGIMRARDRARQADLRICLGETEAEFTDLMQDADILLLPKADLRSDEKPSVSGTTGEGVDTLIAQVETVLSGRAKEAGVAIRLRHEAAMRAGLGALDRALMHLATEKEVTDLAAEDLHSAIRALDSLVGKVDIESVLDDIFSSFCIGK